MQLPNSISFFSSSVIHNSNRPNQLIVDVAMLVGKVVKQALERLFLALLLVLLLVLSGTRCRLAVRLTLLFLSVVTRRGGCSRCLWLLGLGSSISSRGGGVLCLLSLRNFLSFSDGLSDGLGSMFSRRLLSLL